MSDLRNFDKSKLLVLCAGVAVSMTAAGAKPPDCWMTGGGSIFNADMMAEYTGRTTHGMILHCDTRNPNSLQVNWEGNKFHLTDLNRARCPDTPGIDPNPPDASFDTFIGDGEGKLNNVPGASIAFRFTDAGEPGTADTAEIIIWDENFNQVLYVSGPLTFGNHQAHSN